MATYNGAHFIGEQLASIADQTLPPDEIIICDDGSTDNTLAIVETFKRRTPIPVKVHQNPVRLGYSENFLGGMARARSSYISLSDQDDVWHLRKLEICRAALRDNDAVLCAHPMTLVDLERRVIGFATQEITATKTHAPLTLDPWGVFFGFTQLFDRRLIDIIPADQRGLDSYSFDTKLAHDRWIYWLGTHFGTVVTINEPLAEYRQHGSNAFGVKGRTLMDRFRTKVEEGAPRLREFADLAAYRADLLRRAHTDTHGEFLQAATRRWAKLHDHCRTRYQIHTTEAFAARLRLLATNVANGAYRSFGANGLGPKRLLEDVSLGLFGKFVPPAK